MMKKFCIVLIAVFTLGIVYACEAKTEKKVEAAEAAVETAELNSRRDAEKAVQLADLVNGLGLKIDGLCVDCEGEKVKIEGVTPSQSEKEKVILAVGNVEGISQVEDNITVEVPSPEAQYHTVVSGDSLSKIAKKFYGNPMKYPEIFEANKPMLSHPDKIYPGQVLRIPNLD